MTETVLTSKTQKGWPYGYGFRTFPGDGRVVGHTGGTPGCSAALEMHLAGPYSLAVMSNLDPPAAHRIAVYMRAVLRNII